MSAARTVSKNTVSKPGANQRLRWFVLISLSAPPDRFASSARCHSLVAMKAADQHHWVTVTVMGAEVALGYTGTGVPPPGGSDGLQHGAIEFPEYTAVIVLAPCAS